MRSFILSHEENSARDTIMIVQLKFRIPFCNSQGQFPFEKLSLILTDKLASPFLDIAE
jgi:hypothetical protein